jgi:DNA polymerase (family 10)
LKQDPRSGGKLNGNAILPSGPLDASAVAGLLHEFGRRSALGGGNPYRARAYGRAAESLATLTLPLEDLCPSGSSPRDSRRWDAIAHIITKRHTTGTHPSLEAMRKEVPAGVLDFLTNLGCDPTQRVQSTGCHDTHCSRRSSARRYPERREGPRIGTPAKILQGLEIRRSGEGRRHVHRAAALLERADVQLRRAHPI